MRLLAAAVALLAAIPANAQQAPALPEAWKENRQRDFEFKTYMIPMRDGVKLATHVFTPRGALKKPLPVIFERSSYLKPGLSNYLSGTDTPLLANHLDAEMKIFTRGDYIVVLQDIRGRGESEGVFEDQAPPIGSCRPSAKSDEATDAYDSVDWMVKNLPGNNAKVGVWGVSYSGWTAAMALINPHPAVKAVAPMFLPVDTWIGDDYFHNGAFRQSYVLDWAYFMDRRRDVWSSFPYDLADTYAWYLREGTVQDIHDKHMWPSKSWSGVVAHPNYDRWKCYSIVNHLKRGVAGRVPVLNVHAWFDSEDIYGPIALHQFLEPQDKANEQNYLLAGPWPHGSWFDGGSRLQGIDFGSNTGEYGAQIVSAFFDKHLQNAKVDLPQVTAFETGANKWRQYASWPPKETRPLKLYLQSADGLSFKPPGGDGGATSFTSDPSSPVPYAARPIVPPFGALPSGWESWLAADQRFVDGRPDVLTFTSAVLEEDMVIVGSVNATLYASTTGTDADWIVKLIDAYPEEGLSDGKLLGYQLMVSGGIARGSFRESRETRRPIASNTTLPFDIPMPQVNHRFRKGHRIIVQVQSTWFPLYDRNPQTFVPNIMKARVSDLTVQKHSIHHSNGQASHIQLSVLP